MHAPATDAEAALDNAAQSAMIRELDWLTHRGLSLLPTTAIPGVMGVSQAAAKRVRVHGLVTGNSAGRVSSELASACLDSVIT
ncbi:MAG TPA: hypothetical protein DIC65_07255 [Actinobacteria bacterium]|nr:hypothetical protein [Actinomycetota bacterium]